MFERMVRKVLADTGYRSEKNMLGFTPTSYMPETCQQLAVNYSKLHSGE